MARSVVLAALASAAILVPLAPAAPGALHFGPPREVATFDGSVVGGLSEQESGDLNGDGITDLVVTRLTYPPAHVTYPVGILLGDGHGGFADGSSMWEGAPPRTEHARQIVIADFNGDGRNDIFVADHGFDAEPFPGHQNTLALSTPDGKLVDATGTLPPESGFTHSAAAADVNHDGATDLYLGNLCCGDHTPPEILLNDGHGHFTRRLDLLPAQIENTDSGFYTRSIFVDVNRDGSPDLVLGGFTNVPSLVLLNDGTGHFRLGPLLPPKPLGDASILISFATLDVNGDGITDLLAGFQNADFSGRRIQVLVGQGDGTFRDETASRLPEQDSGAGWPYAVRVADVNGDGAPDFGVSVYQANEIAPLYLNDGSGVFHEAPSPQPAGGTPFILVDANRDGHVDLVDSVGGGSFAPERHLVVLQVVQPAAPGGVRATRTAIGVRVSWSASAGATGYEVFRAAGSGRRVRVARVTATSWLDRTARRGKPYSYVVRASNGAGASGFSPPAGVRP